MVSISDPLPQTAQTLTPPSPGANPPATQSQRAVREARGAETRETRSGDQEEGEVQVADRAGVDW